MDVIKTLSKSIREFKGPSMRAPLFVLLESLIETVIPFVTAVLINHIKDGAGMGTIGKYGIVLLVLATLSLLCGVAAGNSCATASTGFARNLRKDLFYKIQDFSFENIDHFQTSSLVTRMTTDIQNIQQAYMMLIRLGFRAPAMLIFSFTTAFIMGGRMAWIFVAVIPILGVGLAVIIRTVMPIFRRVFKKYDRLNDSVQENINGMRVVKSFVREDYEMQKFDRAATDVQRDFTKAERILAFNNPLMQFCLYTVMIFVLSFGSYTIISSRGADLDVGQFSALLTYSFQILMSLMMLSMIFVMVTMSAESAERIAEVLNETSTLTNPAALQCTVTATGQHLVLPVRKEPEFFLPLWIRGKTHTPGTIEGVIDIPHQIDLAVLDHLEALPERRVDILVVSAGQARDLLQVLIARASLMLVIATLLEIPGGEITDTDSFGFRLRCRAGCRQCCGAGCRRDAGRRLDAGRRRGVGRRRRCRRARLRCIHRCRTHAQREQQ